LRKRNKFVAELYYRFTANSDHYLMFIEISCLN